MKRIWYLLALLVLAKESTMAEEAGKPVAFSAVSVPRLWAVDDNARYIVATSRNWTKYYSSPPKDSDFESSIYVIASMGEKPNPGHRIRITQILQDGGRVEVKVQQLQPEPGKIYPQVMVNPIAVAQIKKQDLEQYPTLVFAFVDEGGQPIAETKVDF